MWKLPIQTRSSLCRPALPKPSRSVSQLWLVYPLFSTLWPYWARVMPLALRIFCILINFYPAEPLELLLTVLTLVFEETLFFCRPAPGTPALAAAGNCFLCGPLPSDLARVTSAPPPKSFDSFLSLFPSFCSLSLYSGCFPSIKIPVFCWQHPTGLQALYIWAHLPALFFVVVSWLCCMVCGILVPQLGIESVPPAVKAPCLNDWTDYQGLSPFTLCFNMWKAILILWRLSFRLCFMFVALWGPTCTFESLRIPGPICGCHTIYHRFWN